jgi:predicted O-linked N-acetylglucosamine transferase (SPINDLY family)
VSRCLRQHTIGKLTRGLIANLSRERFEVVVFQGGVRDPMGAAIAATADRAEWMPPSLDGAREQIADAHLDLLFYPDIGMDTLTYFLAFGRLAPVQVVTWGHPVTTGVPGVDYFVSAEALEPAGAEGEYTERLVRLSHLPTYYYRPPDPAAAPDRGRLGLPEDAHLYVCPQSLFKLHPDFDGIVGEILRRDGKGRLVLLEGQAAHWAECVRGRLARACPDVVERVVFVPRQSFEGFQNLLQVADVVLDPVHFTGGNSTYEGLALGAPIVTWPSGRMRGRVTYGCYRQMGWEELVAESHEGYVERAVRVATDREWRAAVCARIRETSGVLYEDRTPVRELEAFFETAVAAAREAGGR